MFYLFVFWIVLECTTTVFYWIHSNWEKNLSKVRRPWTQAWKENPIIQIEIQSQEVAVTKHKAPVLQTVISMPTAGRRWAANVALYSFKWCWLKQNNRLMDDKKNPEANDVPEGVRLSCLLITRQSVGKVWPTLGWCDAEGQRRREENKKTSKRGQREFFFFLLLFSCPSAEFLLKNIPQVQQLLWSTKLPNVLIPCANAAGTQEDGARLSQGRTLQ